MTEEKPRATTLRADPETLRKARYFLDKHGKTINEFLVEQLERFIHECEQQKAHASAQ